jgi:hypothetical protein
MPRRSRRSRPRKPVGGPRRAIGAKEKPRGGVSRRGKFGVVYSLILRSPSLRKDKATLPSALSPADWTKNPAAPAVRWKAGEDWGVSMMRPRLSTDRRALAVLAESRRLHPDHNAGPRFPACGSRSVSPLRICKLARRGPGARRQGDRGQAPEDHRRRAASAYESRSRAHGDGKQKAGDGDESPNSSQAKAQFRR